MAVLAGIKAWQELRDTDKLLVGSDIPDCDLEKRLDSGQAWRGNRVAAADAGRELDVVQGEVLGRRARRRIYPIRFTKVKAVRQRRWLHDKNHVLLVR